MLGGAGSAALLRVEQTDLINYGLIPEFVGRFPVISTLQARPRGGTCAQLGARSAASARSSRCRGAALREFGWRFKPLLSSCACEALGGA